MVVFPLCRWCPPQETSQPHPPHILDQEIQNNGGCLEAAGPDRERLLQPITWPIYLPYTTAQGQYHCASNIISNSHPFRSKWVDPPIPEIQQFQYFTMKIQSQGHGWGQSLKSQCKYNILLTRIPFVPCQRPLKRRLKVQHSDVKLAGTFRIFPTTKGQVCISSLTRPLRYSVFKIWPWKSKVNVIPEGQIMVHKEIQEWNSMTFPWPFLGPFQVWTAK